MSNTQLEDLDGLESAAVPSASHCVALSGEDALRSGGMQTWISEWGQAIGARLRKGVVLKFCIDAEGELVRQAELGGHRHHVHPYKDYTSEASQHRSTSNWAEGRIIWIDTVFEHELVERLHQCGGQIGPEVLG